MQGEPHVPGDRARGFRGKETRLDPVLILYNAMQFNAMKTKNSITGAVPLYVVFALLYGSQVKRLESSLSI